MLLGVTFTEILLQVQKKVEVESINYLAHQPMYVHFNVALYYKSSSSDKPKRPLIADHKIPMNIWL